MFQGMNPRQMQRMMEQMGVKTQEIKAERVIIEKEGSQIIITDPQIIETSMKGQRSFNISGNIEEKALIKEDDLKLVMEKTGASREKAEQALAEFNGDIAGAIMKIQGA
ncbi:MAG: nascent polypeptide-associated complex protein [Candidatus Micrarchaeota archaeon]|nr:nascent polypeptide-associated complex protein [Candidatus Micrarchaeota archaeon]